MAEVRWDPEVYLRFADHRERPFHELLARVEVAMVGRAPSRVLDLGCGPGTLTRTLLDRWPGASVLGVDSSPEMVERARSVQDAGDGRFAAELGDLRTWAPGEGERFDVVVTNATLQWVPGHLELLPRLVGLLAPGGVLALQVPGNFDSPSHVLLAGLRSEPRWRGRLGAAAERAASSADPGDYLEALATLGCDVDAWETTYAQVLPGDDAVLRWMEGTGLRPVLTALDAGDPTGADRERFLAEYAELLRGAYPLRPWGTVLPFRRVFAVARTATSSSDDS
ncbi:MAG TPA: methyltransferase domain-containing protein [Motilibacteraceae bacterium]|nr:methyltransferase domain-containing protein [Motilibacteraceae bacterium]